MRKGKPQIMLGDEMTRDKSTWSFVFIPQVLKIYYGMEEDKWMVHVDGMTGLPLDIHNRIVRLPDVVHASNRDSISSGDDEILATIPTRTKTLTSPSSSSEQSLDSVVDCQREEICRQRHELEQQRIKIGNLVQRLSHFENPESLECSTEILQKGRISNWSNSAHAAQTGMNYSPKRISISSLIANNPNTLR